MVLLWLVVFIYCLFIDASVNIAPIDKHAVFANNEISFRYINVYGFDYDYTLANYSKQLHHLIYNLASKNLVKKYGVSIH